MGTSARKIMIGAVALIAMSSQPAVATARTQPARPATATPAYCVIEAIPAGSLAAAQPTAPACFATFAAAIGFATDGSVRLPPAATGVTQAQLDAGRAEDRLASTVIGIEYEGPSFSGTQWIISQANGCNDGGAEVWLRSDLTGNPMNNVISSAKTYAGCLSRHFDLPSFGGSSYLCWCATMGAMDNRTTSIRWSATGF